MVTRSRKAKFLTHQLITKRMAAAEIDIAKSATEMIREYGTEAEREAANQAAQRRAAGEDDAAAIWSRIAAAIRGLIVPHEGPLN